MKRIYTSIFIALMLFAFSNISRAQTEPDSAKVVLLRVKESKPDVNWSGKATALCDFENDLLAKASIADFTMTSDQVDSVMLRIFFKAPDVKGDLAFYDMNPDWVDTTVTWNSAASLTVSDTPFATLTVDQDADAHYWLNITEYMKTALDKGIDFGWRIVAVDDIASATSRTSYHADYIMQPTIFLYQKDVTGIRNSEQGRRVAVFPNPASDYTMVSIGETTDGYLNVYNTVGARVLRKKVDSEHMRLDLTSLKTGVYFITVESDLEVSEATKILVR